VTRAFRRALADGAEGAAAASAAARGLGATMLLHGVGCCDVHLRRCDMRP
jgi:hypothetical protein